MDFMSALRWCATQAGLEFPEKEMNPEEEMRYKQKAAQRIAIEAAAKFFQKNLQQAESFLATWKSHTNLTHPGKYFRPSKVKIMRPTSPK